MNKVCLLSGRLFLGLVLLHYSVHAENASKTVNAEKAPRVFIADSAVLPKVRAFVQQDAEGDTPFADAYARLCSDADAWLDTGPFSVMSKTGMPPSGDKHDYWSVGPYWWPDPESADGLPYIRRDGKVNPEYRQGVYDADAFLTCSRAVHELALAAYFSGKKAYGEHGLRLLRTWFLDAETKMNPNMRYAQAIPGRNDGRDVGVVEAESLRHLPDAIGMLTSTGHWTEQDEAAMQQWCRAFLDWMLHSGALKHYLAKGGHNNIAIGLDSLVIALALYTRQPDVAREQITRLSMERIANQIEADGRMPQELARTKAFGYSIKALTSFFIVARLAEHLDIDLWKYTTENGRSLRLALDFLLPFVYTPKDFNYEGPVDPQQMGRTVLPLAIRAWNDDSHRKAYTHLGGSERTYPEQFVFPTF